MFFSYFSWVLGTNGFQTLGGVSVEHILLQYPSRTPSPPTTPVTTGVPLLAAATGQPGCTQASQGSPGVCGG